MVNVAGGHCQGRLCLAKPAASGRSGKRCSTNQKFIRMGFVRQSSRILGLELVLLLNTLYVIYISSLSLYYYMTLVCLYIYLYYISQSNRLLAIKIKNRSKRSQLLLYYFSVASFYTSIKNVICTLSNSKIFRTRSVERLMMFLKLSTRYMRRY